jgi:hypothetical protein
MMDASAAAGPDVDVDVVVDVDSGGCGMASACKETLRGGSCSAETAEAGCTDPHRTEPEAG